mmetsp:Transcript_22708/g.33427  ORF Transcript_22708/g.33427 Transcript_22708/m.33427 type:complete len:299 (+) Transcript_22708:127-1023(+)
MRQGLVRGIVNNRKNNHDERWNASAKKLHNGIQNGIQNNMKHMSRQRPLTSCCGSIVRDSREEDVKSSRLVTTLRATTAAEGAKRCNVVKPIITPSLLSSRGRQQQSRTNHFLKDNNGCKTNLSPSHKQQMPRLTSSSQRRPWTSSCNGDDSYKRTLSFQERNLDTINVRRRFTTNSSTHQLNSPTHASLGKRRNTLNDERTTKKKVLIRCASQVISKRERKELKRLGRHQSWPRDYHSSSATVVAAIKSEASSNREKKEREKERYRAEIYEINRVMKIAFDTHFAAFMKMKQSQNGI